MKLVFVTHFLPYPPNDGGKIGYFNPVKYLSRRHEIVLVSLAAPGDHANIDALRSLCCEVVPLMESPTQRFRMLRGALGRPPGTASRYYSKTFGEIVRDVIRKHRPDIVELQHLNTAAYLPFCDSGPVILREHNVEFKIWERFANSFQNPIRRSSMRMLAGRVRRYEASMASRFARCVTVSEADEKFLREVAPTARILTIPSGVDSEYFTAEPCAAEEPCSMVITGSFAWQPKQQSLRVMIADIFPLIRARLPNARLTVVGKGVPPQLRDLAQKAGVAITGLVPDVRPFVRPASLVLNYLESGGGIALKVLESFAMRKPVLSNTLGIEGIRVTPGHHCVVADGTASFAAAAAELLVNPQRRLAIAEAGHRLVEQEYAWSGLVSRFEAVYSEVLAEHRGVRPAQ